MMHESLGTENLPWFTAEQFHVETSYAKGISHRQRETIR